MKIIPVILSGGSGTRLWPVSRQSKPKQFLKIAGERTLFQDTVLRCRDEIYDQRPIVVGANPHRFLLAEDLAELGVSADIILEPVARNSCAAIAVACLQASRRQKDALVLILAADHAISDSAAFGRAAALAAKDAVSGYLVTFGIKPTRPATSYGYILPGDRLGSAYRVEKFVEKPSFDIATGYLEDGYLWNSGNFLFRADVFLAELGLHNREILAAATLAFEKQEADLDFLRLDEAEFSKSPSISVDFAVMEHTGKAAVLPVNYSWSDIGSWDALGEVREADSNGNVVQGKATMLDSRNSIIHSHDQLCALIGMEDTIVVTTRDAVLVANRNRAEDVKVIVDDLKDADEKAASESLQIFRPWGNYEQLDAGDGYQVKRIEVKPGGILSLQKHKHRSEHWVVVNGVAEVTIGEEVRQVHPNESAYIPIGAVHRLANHGDKPVVLIEVQSGDYLGEDDIIRLEDTYNRGKTYKGI